MERTPSLSCLSRLSRFVFSLDSVTYLRYTFGMLTIKEWLESLREKGLGFYEAMDYLDMAATHNGFDGPVYYVALCEVYADWQYPKKPKRHPASKLPQGEWLILQKKYDFRCFYCGDVVKLTKDHIIPVSKGGKDTIDNIVPACMSCNRKKGVKLYETTKRIDEKNTYVGQPI